MPKTFSLTAKQRDELLDIYRKDTDPELRFRAHIILLLGEGYAWDTIEAMLFCSSRTVDRWLKRFRAEGVAGLTGRKRGRPFRLGLGWVALLVTWVTTKTPGDFGFLRSRWSCALLALLLREREGVDASRETVRRLLHRGHLVYRRPRPVLKPDEEQRQAKLAELRGLLEGPAGRRDGGLAGRGRGPHQPQDRPDVDAQGQAGGRSRRRAPTRSGTSSGSIHWRTGQVFVTEAAPKQGRDGALFIKHLDELRRRLRRYKKVHVICDNAELPHQPGGDRVPLEVGGPDRGPPAALLLAGPATRSSGCGGTCTRTSRGIIGVKDLGELLEKVFAWLGQENPFEIEGSVYPKAKAA